MKPSLDPNIIDLEDIIGLIKKKKQKLYSLALIAFCFGFFLALIKTPEYTATSVFKEGGSKVDALSASMMKSIFKESSLFTNPTQALALMRSRSFCTPLVQEMGLQAHIREKNLFLEVLGRIKKRYALCFQGNYPSYPIYAHHVNYRSLKVSSILIEPLETALKLTYENRTWEVPKKNQTIVFKDGSFDIEVSGGLKKAHRIVLMPVDKALDRTQKKFKIKSRREDGAILDLSFTDDQEKRGVRFLNRVMEQYQEHLLSEQKKLAKNQLAYLHLRQEQIQQDFNAALEKHARHLESGLSEQGFLALQQHLEHIQTQKQGNFEKEKQIQLKLITLEQLAQERNYTFHEPFLGESCKHLQEQLFTLSKERQQIPKTFLVHRPLGSNIAWINETTHLKDPQFFQILNPSSRLSNQEYQTFQPLNLQLAKESYKKIQERLDALDETKQGLDQAAQMLDQESATMSSIKEWIKDWEKAPLIIELSAAETLLEDPYRSFKEKEYIKKENQTKRVTLKKELQKKAQVAQSKIIKLTKQQQSVKEQIAYFLELEKKVIENEIEHQWQEKKELLKLEQEQIAEAQKKIQKQEQQLPQKWLQENQLRLEADLNLALMEGLSKMFESKNIEANLAYLQSEVIDPAFVSLTPKTLSAFPFGAILAAMSLVTLIGYEIARAMRKGFPLSLVGLKHRGFKVAKHQNLAELYQYLHQAQLSSSMSVVSIFKADFNSDIPCFRPKWLVIEVTPVATLSYEKVLTKLCTQKASRVSLSCEELLKWLYDPKLYEWITRMRQTFSLICFVSDPKNGTFITQALCRCSDQILLELGEMSSEDVEPFGQEHFEKTVIFSVTNKSIV